jgi:tartrate-resistant acid phosphatase type 5
MRWIRAFVCVALLLPLTVVFAQTPPAPAAPAASPAPVMGDVNLLTMGDWGTNGESQKQVAATMVHYVSAVTKPFDGMLLVGDNFYMNLPGGIKDPMWQSAFENMYDAKVLSFPFYAALGNHDYQNNKDAIELEYAKANPDSRWKLPARWYRVDLPADNPLVTILMLDSDKDPLGADRWNQEKAWIDTELAKPRGTWTLCCAHHPLFSNGGHGDNGVLQKDWGDLFKKYNVDFYICGHDHDLQHLEIPTWFTSFVLVGGGGADLKLMLHDDRGPMSRLTHGFGCLAFTRQLATVRFVNADGKTLHLFTRDKSGKIDVQIVGGNDKSAFNSLRALEGFGPSDK